MIAEGDEKALEWRLIRLLQDGNREPLMVRVGYPVYREEPFPGWRCGFSVEGYLDSETTLVGATALQALGLALKVLRDVLRTAAEETTLVEAQTGQVLNAEMLSDALH